jgi:hypothetical protein
MNDVCVFCIHAIDNYIFECPVLFFIVRNFLLRKKDFNS